MAQCRWNASRMGERLVSAIGGAENALMLIAAYMSAPFIKALLVAGKAVGGLGLALTATPFGAFMTAISALVTAGWWLYKNWEKISAGVKKFCTEIGNAVQGASDVQEAADLHGIDLEDTDALMDPENARILAEAAGGSRRDSSSAAVTPQTDFPDFSENNSLPATGSSGFSSLARSGTVSSETVRKEEKEVTHKVELIVPAGMEARVDQQASDAVTVKRDNMGYGWSFAGGVTWPRHGSFVSSRRPFEGYRFKYLRQAESSGALRRCMFSPTARLRTRKIWARLHSFTTCRALFRLFVHDAARCFGSSLSAARSRYAGASVVRQSVCGACRARAHAAQRGRRRPLAVSGAFRAGGKARGLTGAPNLMDSVSARVKSAAERAQALADSVGQYLDKGAWVVSQIETAAGVFISSVKSVLAIPEGLSTWPV